MNDTLLNAALLGLLVAVAVAAGMSPESAGSRSAAPVVDMPVVVLPAVTVTARRQAPVDGVGARAGLPAVQVVQLPAVEVTGRRVPAMETVTLAHAE